MSETSLPQSEDQSNASRYLPAMLLLFVGSGCAALIYEIVWYQMLQLVIGLTTISLGLLLGSFMGGMCLGSLLFSKLVARTKHPLRVYACLELGIGILGLLILWFMPSLEALYTHIGDGRWNIELRALVAAICLVPPTVLMGATLPAIARWVEATPTGVSWMGFFYGGNIVGAVFGCLLAGFYLLRVYDMAFATYVAAAINVCVAVLAMGLASVSPFIPPPPNPEAAKARFDSVPGAWAVYLTIALSGLSALGAEVVWTRLLSLLFGGTVYTFSIILAVFLFGLGIGSSFGSFTARSTSSPRIALGVCQLLLTAAIAWTAYMISDSLPFWPINPELLDAKSDMSYMSPWYVFQMDIARTMWTILPAAVLWGASFPLALAAVANRGQDPGRLVGRVYAANTVGAIIGALAFSIWLVPGHGTQWCESLLIGLAGFSTLVALAPMLVPSATPRRVPTFAISMLVLAALVSTPLFASNVHPARWGAIAYGRFIATYRNTGTGKSMLVDKITAEEDVPQGDGTSDIYCVYAGEGLNGTVAVTKTTAGVRSFHSAGKVQASNSPQDMRLQRMLGYISSLAVKDPKSVLVVACGAGVTAGTFLQHPTIERIVICDIEPLVPKYVTPMFSKENYGITDRLLKENPTVIDTPYGKKTVQVVFDDGRHFIRTTKEKFDIITSDPIDPWVKGCAALNTVEYYTMGKEHLNPGGVMTLWIPFYESNIPTAKSVLGTFFKVFPDGILFSNDYGGEGYDAVLFGQNGPSTFNIDELQARMNSPAYAGVKQSLREASFPSAVDLFGTYAADAPNLQKWMADAKINTDKNMRLQYLAGMSLNSYIGRDILSDITRYYVFPDKIFEGSASNLAALRQAIEVPRGVTIKRNSKDPIAPPKEVTDAQAADDNATPAPAPAAAANAEQ